MGGQNASPMRTSELEHALEEIQVPSEGNVCTSLVQALGAVLGYVVPGLLRQGPSWLYVVHDEVVEALSKAVVRPKGDVFNGSKADETLVETRPDSGSDQRDKIRGLCRNIVLGLCIYIPVY